MAHPNQKHQGKEFQETEVRQAKLTVTTISRKQPFRCTLKCLLRRPCLYLHRCEVLVKYLGYLSMNALVVSTQHLVPG